MSSLIRAPLVRNLACPTAIAVASIGARYVRKLHTLPRKLDVPVASLPLRTLPPNRLPLSRRQTAPLVPLVPVPARGFWFFRPRPSPTDSSTDLDQDSVAESSDQHEVPASEERPLTPAEEAEIHFSRYLDALYRSRQAGALGGVPGGIGTGDHAADYSSEAAHGLRFHAAAAAAAAAAASAGAGAPTGTSQGSMEGGQGTRYDSQHQPFSFFGGLKHWLFSFRFVTLVLTGVAVVATIGGTGYWIYGRNLNTRIRNMAAEVTATTLSNDSTKDGAVELSNKILGEPIVLQAAVAFVHKLSQDKDTKDALVSLLGSVVSDPSAVASLKELVVALARDPATAAALGDLVSTTLQEPGVKEAAYEVFKQLLDDPKTRAMVHTVLIQITRRYLASPDVHEATKKYLVEMLADRQLHVSSGHALWETLKSAVYPRS